MEVSLCGGRVRKRFRGINLDKPIIFWVLAILNLVIDHIDQDRNRSVGEVVFYGFCVGFLAKWQVVDRLGYCGFSLSLYYLYGGCLGVGFWDF